MEEPTSTSKIDSASELAKEEKMLRSSDLKTRAMSRRKILLKNAQPIREEIQKKYGHILDISPATVMIPTSPTSGSENKLLEYLKDAVKWAKSQEGVNNASIYKLIEGDPRDKPPQYILIIGTEDRNIVERMGDSEEGRRIQRMLTEVSVGESANEERVFVMNNMLMGLK